MSDFRRVISLSPGFASQFTAEGNGYHYRWACRGAAIPVSAAERNGFVADFNWSLGLQVLALLAGIAAVALFAIRSSVTPVAHPVVIIVAGVSLTTTLVALTAWAAWRAPVQALSNRAPVAPPRAAAEVRRSAWAWMRWPQFAFSGGWILFLFELGARRKAPADRLAWWGLAAILFLAMTFAAYKTWRAPSHNSDLARS
jgi:hypothetical protein